MAEQLRLKLCYKCGVYIGDILAFLVENNYICDFCYGIFFRKFHNQLEDGLNGD